MRKNHLLVAILFSIIVQLNAQVNLQESLKVHFPFSNSIQETSGNGVLFTTTSKGSYLTTDKSGVSNQALFFNGAFEQGLVSLPIGFIDTMSVITMCGWINPSVFVSGGQGIFGQDNVLEVTAFSGPNRLRVYHPVSGTIDVNLTQPIGTWYHVAVTANTSGLKIYINGVESATRTGNYKLSSSGYSTNIGANVISQSSNNYAGKVDDFRIYSRGLTLDEIQFLAGALPLTYDISNLANTSLCAGATVNIDYTIIGSGIADTNTFTLQLSDLDGDFNNPTTIGFKQGNSSSNINGVIPSDIPQGAGYKMRIVSNYPSYIGNVSTQTFTINNPSDGMSTLSRGKVLELRFDGNANDHSEFARHGIEVGGVSYVADRHGNATKAIKLNGTNGHIVLPQGVWLNGGAFSSSVWVMPHAFNNWSRIFDIGNGANNENVVWALSNSTTGKTYASIRQGTTEVGIVDGAVSKLNTWNHCALVHNGTSLSLYVNGVLVATATSSSPRMLTRLYFYIGRSLWAADAYANASFDDFILWDRALTENEVKLLASDGGIISNTPVCNTNTIFFEKPIIEGATYNWSGPNGFTSLNRANYINNASSIHSGTYRVTVTVNGCSATDSLKSLSVTTPSTQSATSFIGLPKDTYIGAPNAVLTATPSGGFYNGLGISNNNFIPSKAGVGAHSILYNFKNTEGCHSNNASIVTVHPNNLIDLGEEVSCSGSFFDAGGESANYGNNEKIIKTFTSASNEMLQFTFTGSSLAYGDTLFAFNGPDTNSRILVAYTSGSRWEGFTSSGKSVTFMFKSNGSGTASGWKAQYVCTSTPQASKNYSISNSIVAVCNGKFYDDGGTGNHGDGGSYQQTFYSVDGKKIKFAFTSFNTAGSSDILRIYDGPNTNFPLLTSRSGGSGAFTVESTGDVLTFTFQMFTNGLTSPGWVADVSCTDEPLVDLLLTDTSYITCGATLYDHAGPASNYEPNRNDTMVLQSASDKLLQLIFNHNETGIGTGDTLFVFDGNSVNAPLMAIFVNGSRLDNIISNTRYLTFVFKSDATSQGKGFMASITCVDAPVPIVNINMSTGTRGLCSGIVRDPGGAGNYAVGTNTTQVFRSLDGNRLKFTFSELAINGNNGGHWLHIYDGPNSSYPRIGSYNQWAWPPNSIVESTGEYLTFNFNSTNASAGASAGFTGSFSCTTPVLQVIPMTKGTFNVCDAVISDNGGITANYSANASDTTTLCSANEQLLQVNFNHNETGLGSGDTLWIFDGNTVTAPLIGIYLSNSRLNQVTSTGTCLTFVFRSDATNQAKGWQGRVSCVTSPPEKANYIMSRGERFVCSGIFYDNGGTGNYSTGEWIQTFTSYSGEKIRATQTSFSVNGNNGGHWLTVYDGPSTASPVIGSYNNFNYPPSVFQSSGKSLTFRFNSTNTSAGNSAGFSYNMSCFTGFPMDVEWLNSPICAGSTSYITYTLNSSVNAGNIFRAQLSDMNGSFASPVNIGNIIDTSSGVISVTIPTGTIAGNNYRIRITSSSPAMIGSVSPNPVVIFALPQTPNISTSDNLTICNGIGSTTLNINPQSGVNYRWIKDTLLTVGRNQPSYIATETGVYTVEVSNSCDTILSSNNKIVKVNYPAYAPSIIAYGDTSFCQGEQLLLSVKRDSSCTYQWYKGASTIGSNDTSLLVNSADEYKVRLTNACGVVWSHNIIKTNIKGASPTAPAITATGATEFCLGDSVYLSILPQAGVNYQWLRDDSVLIEFNTNVLKAKSTGKYSSIVSNECGVALSGNKIDVTVKTPPIAFDIIPQSAITFCQGDSVRLTIRNQNNTAYQWKKNSSNIGLSDTSFVAKESGDYTVVMSNSCGAISSSNTITIVVHSLPSIPILSALSKTNLCPSEKVKLQCTHSGETITWYHDDNIISGQISDSLTTGITGNYRVKLTNANNCISSSNTIHVSLINKPSAVISSPQNGFCPSVSLLTLTANSDTASYKWLKDNSVISGATSINYEATTIGNYKVVLTYGNGCSDTSAVKSLITADNPTVNMSVASSFCTGSSTVATANAITGASYTWYKGSAIAKGPSTSNTLTINSAGNYSVHITNIAGCKDSSTVALVNETPVPNATISASFTTFCQGQETTLSASVVAGATYEWFRNNVSLGTAEIDKSTFTTSTAGTYKVTISKNGCSATSSNLILTQVGLPGNAGGVSGITSSCAGGSHSFSITNVTGATGYLWEIIPSSAASVGNGQGTNNVTVNVVNQNFQVKVTPYNNCGNGGSSTKSVSIDNTTYCTMGNVLFSGHETNVSTGVSITFRNHTDNSWYMGASPRWNFGSNATPSTANGNGPHVVTYSGTGAKTVSLEYVADMGGFVIGSASKSDYIQINTGTGVNTSEIQGSTSVNYCTSTETYRVDYTAGSTYNWTVPSGAVINSGQGTNQISVKFNGNAGVISVVETATGGKAGATKSITVTCGASSIHKSSDTYRYWSVYPIPTQNELNITPNDAEAKPFKVVIIGINGSELLTATSTYGEPLQINVENLSEGIYILKIQTKDEVFGLKFLKGNQ